MHWLVPAACGALGALIFAYFDEEERAARSRWEQQRIQISRTVEEHRRNVELHLAAAQRGHDTHLLRDLHHSSRRVADEAYRVLQDARASLDAIGKVLVQTKDRRDTLRHRLNTTGSYQARAQVRRELSELDEFRRSLFRDKDALKVQRDTLVAEVQRLNAQTGGLKRQLQDRVTRGYGAW